MIIDWNVALAVKPEDLDAVLKGVSDDGNITEEAKKILADYIKLGKSKECPMGELKRQFRKTLGPAEGKKIADAIDKLW